MRLSKNKIVRIVFTDFSPQNCFYALQNLSFGFILKIFLKFRKCQPRYSYKIYSYRKKACIDKFVLVSVSRKEGHTTSRPFYFNISMLIGRLAI